jgi:hypothetical protein
MAISRNDLSGRSDVPRNRWASATSCGLGPPWVSNIHGGPLGLKDRRRPRPMRRFDDPIPLPNGRRLVTLEDAADYIMKLPKAEQHISEWQTAIGCLIGAAEGRDFMMHSRMGVLRALNRNVERTFNASHKDSHWGKRKLKRDQ